MNNKIKINGIHNTFIDGYKFKTPNNPPRIKDDEEHMMTHINIKLYADFGDGNGYTTHDGMIAKYFADGVAYKYYIGGIQLGTYFESGKLMRYRKRGNTPNAFYWAYCNRLDIENENEWLEEEVVNVKADALDRLWKKDEVIDDLRKQIHGFKTELAEVLDKRADQQKELDNLKLEYHEALSQQAKKDHESGLTRLAAEASKVISLLVSNKIWQDNIYDSVSQLLVEGEVKKRIDENEMLSNHRLERTLNYNSKLLQRIEAMSMALVLMNNEINEQKEINNELEKKLQSNRET